MGSIFTIPAGTSFVDALAEQLMIETSTDPLALTDIDIYLPTRRGARLLQEAFLRASKGKATLLPNMMVLGDLDEDQLSIHEAGLGMPALDLRKPLDPIVRQFLLTKLILGAGSGLIPRPDLPGADEMDADFAFALAQSLGMLMDQAETEGVDFKKVAALQAPGELSAHWELASEFLHLVANNWPGLEEGIGAMGTAKRRRQLLEQQTEIWTLKPPSHRIIAAGSTGSIPSTRHFLTTVASLPNGNLILPGLDQSLSDEVWDAVCEDASHPQHNLSNLLHACDCDRNAVALWPGCEKRLSDRQAVLSRAMLPAVNTGQWRQTSGKGFPETEPPLRDFTLLECANSFQEADAIALLMRDGLEAPIAGTPKTTVLITPDRNLARRVEYNLQRWGIAIDDSAGLPLKNTSAGLLIRSLTRIASERFSTTSVAAVLKHPFVQIGADEGRYKSLLVDFERHVLRGERPRSGLDFLVVYAEDKIRRLSGKAPELAQELIQALGDFTRVIQQALKPLEGPTESRQPFEKHLSALLATLENIARPEKMWRGQPGDALGRLFESLQRIGLDAYTDIGAISATAFAEIIDRLLESQAVRAAYGTHPRLAIWGTLEGRLHLPDRVILGGLNEGLWPSDSEPGPWLSRSMRQEAGLPSIERKIGLMAHDFAQAAGAHEVFVTRSLKEGGAETTASRWLQRLDAVLGEQKSTLREGADYWLSAANALHQPQKIEPWPKPNPKPPLEHRPNRLSVTRIETLIRDPYSIYAESVLRLRALEQLEEPINVAKRGEMIHAIFEAFVRANQATPKMSEPEKNVKVYRDQLLRLGQQHFAPLVESAPGIYAFWWPRFERVARWFAATWAEDRKHIIQSFVEHKGVLVRDGFTLSAKADRIDEREDGNFAIIDYKTGVLPSTARVKAAIAVQLPLTAIVLRDGGFGEISFHTDDPSFEYWQTSGSGSEVGKKLTFEDSQEAAIEAAEERLDDLIAHYRNPETGYEVLPDLALAPRYNAYELLERGPEWGLLRSDDEVDYDAA